MAAPFYPFVTFNFSVEIKVDGISPKLCSAAFSDCDGLEMTMEVKTIRQGGDNGSQIRLTGPVALGTLTLKRGMTTTFDLWNWFKATIDDPRLRGTAKVVMLSADGASERAVFRLSRCVPVKIKAPALNAKDGAVAIEEMQLAYETLTMEAPGA